jgi:broad specificity phosphatase PhoE
MSEIYLIRHGQASFGEEVYDKLSPTGIRQARVLARHLAHLNPSFDMVYCGTMERQRTTAQEVLGSFAENGNSLPQPRILNAFDEYDSHAVWNIQIPQMLKEDPSLSKDLDRVYTDRKAFQRLFEAVMTRWISGAHDPPEGPRWHEFTRGVRAGLREIMEKHGPKKKLAVFTSGGPISAAVQTALELSDEKTMGVSWQIMNASITRFKYSANGVSLAGFNDVTHLELEKDKDLLTYR